MVGTQGKQIGCSAHQISQRAGWWKHAGIVLILAALTGCAGVGRPHDPPAGTALFEQIPKWDRAADKICCGHLKSCGKFQSPAC
jgi:hypothetical protein